MIWTAESVCFCSVKLAAAAGVGEVSGCIGYSFGRVASGRDESAPCLQLWQAAPAAALLDIGAALQGKVYSDIESMTAVSKAVGPMIFSFALSFGRRIVSLLLLKTNVSTLDYCPDKSFGF